MKLDQFVDAEASKHGVRKPLVREYATQLQRFKTNGADPSRVAEYFRYTYGPSRDSPYRNEAAVKAAFGLLEQVK